MRALVTERVGPGTSFIPFHFAGWWQGKDLLDKYPDGAAPIVRGEAVNTGHDLRLRLGDDDAGNQDDALQHRARLTEGDDHGQNEIHL